MGVYRWMGFRVGEKLSEEVGHIVQSGDVVGNVTEGRVGKIRANRQSKFVRVGDGCWKADQIVWQILAVGAIGR